MNISPTLTDTQRHTLTQTVCSTLFIHLLRLTPPPPPPPPPSLKHAVHKHSRCLTLRTHMHTRAHAHTAFQRTMGKVRFVSCTSTFGYFRKRNGEHTLTVKSLTSNGDTDRLFKGIVRFCLLNYNKVFESSP